MTTYKYTACDKADAPAAVRFDCPTRFQGQSVLVEFGDIGRAAHDDGSAYKRVKDQSEGWAEWRYYKLIDG